MNHTETAYRYDLRDIEYIDDFDDDGIKKLIDVEFKYGDKEIDKDIELYKWQSMDSKSPYLLKTITTKQAQEIQSCAC
jgi:hypothetical protein